MSWDEEFYDEFEREEEEEVDWEEVERVKDRLKTWKERVEWVLARFPQARNDDFYLWLLCVRFFAPEASKYIRYIPYRVFKKFPHFETVRRVRQKLQATGKYLPTDPKVLKRRKKLAYAWRKAVHEI